MKPKWWSVEVQCQTCKVPADINGVNFSADSEIAICVTCPKCKESFRWHIFATALAHRALVNDLMNEKVEKLVRATPLRPPLSLPATPERLTVRDAKWLKEMNVDPEDGGLE